MVVLVVIISFFYNLDQYAGYFSRDDVKTAMFFLIPVGVIAGYNIFPEWRACVLFGPLLGLILSFVFSYETKMRRKIEEAVESRISQLNLLPEQRVFILNTRMNDKCGKYRILSFLVLLVTIFVMVLAAAYLPQDWYAFKYFVVACAGVLASLLFSLVAVSESAASSSEETAVSEPEPEVTFESAMAELNQLIGLKEIKDAVKDFADAVRIQLIANNGDRTSLSKYHFVLEGNPGTGKTTVAKILAKIFYAIGLLPTSKCVEVTRRGLVGEYISHTAPLVKKNVMKLSGVCCSSMKRIPLSVVVKTILDSKWISCLRQ